MGMDCTFIAENPNGITPEQIEDDFKNGLFPTCPMSFGFTAEYVKKWYIEEGFIVWSDAYRLAYYREYQRQVIEYFKNKCGGQAGVYADIIDDDGVIGFIRSNPDKAWSQLQDLSHAARS